VRQCLTFYLFIPVSFMPLSPPEIFTDNDAECSFVNTLANPHSLFIVNLSSFPSFKPTIYPTITMLFSSFTALFVASSALAAPVSGWKREVPQGLCVQTA